jgi:hypothetical protein
LAESRLEPGEDHSSPEQDKKGEQGAKESQRISRLFKTTFSARQV